MSILLGVVSIRVDTASKFGKVREGIINFHQASKASKADKMKKKTKKNNETQTQVPTPFVSLHLDS